jgi:uncharacterized cupredoxin-like copper-binding protein
MDRQQMRGAARAVACTSVTLALAACGSDAEQTTRQSPTATASASAAPAREAPQSSIEVALAEYSISPSPATGKAGQVTFKVQNSGQIKHEFAVIKTARAADSLLKGEEADETGLVGEIEDVEPADSKTLALKLKPGHYALICNLPGHYMPAGKPGMLADFTVQ